MRPIPVELLAGPFTSQQAARCGVTPRQLQGQRFRRLFRDVYVVAALPVTTQLRVAGLALVLPQGAVVAGTTAALLHGADVRAMGDDAVDVTMVRAEDIRRRGVRASAAYLEPGDVVEVLGIPVTSPVRTAFDLARRRPLIERVVGVDAMLNRGGCAFDGLAAYVADHPQWRGIRWAREALTHAEPRAESPMESRQRMHLVLGGLPRPEAQFTLYDEHGEPFAVLDHAYEKWRVAPEYDGEPHASRWRYDLERQERIRHIGWWHRRYTSISTARGWDLMVDEVRQALISRGWRPA